MKTKLNIFVTGASGFIGKQLTLQLLEEGYKVIAITRQSRPPFEFPDLIWTSWEEYSKAISLNDSIFAVFNLVTTYGHKGENFSEIHKCNVAKPLELFKYACNLLFLII